MRTRPFPLPARGQSISTGGALGGRQSTGVLTDAFPFIGRGRTGGEIPVPTVRFACVGIVLWSCSCWAPGSARCSSAS